MKQPQQLLTASRIATYLGCQRRHFYRYEIGLDTESHSEALRFGTAWHTAMELRAEGVPYDDIGVTMTTHLDGLPWVQINVMLAGYYRLYGDGGQQDLDYEPLLTEEEFTHSIDGSRAFKAGGKIDKVVRLPDGRSALMEHKTTSDSLDDDSGYWLRMRNSVQNYQYGGATIRAGWDIHSIIYDVVRKPTIRPLSSVPCLDEDGRKIIVGPDGERLIKSNGEPYASVPKNVDGHALTREETLEEYAERLLADVLMRPDFYYARREIPILHDDLMAFEAQRQEIAKEILHKRSRERLHPDRPRELAWFKNVSQMSCQSCPFSGFCLQNIPVDPANPPVGFIVGEQNPELETVE